MVKKNLHGGHLKEGMSHSLPYGEDFFDVIVLGFCLYQVPREYLSKTIYEVDRVLKECGFVVISDFDSPIAYVRRNVHNKKMPVYKHDYSSFFTSQGYTLIEKHSYDSKGTRIFNPDIQQRESLQILYKEKSNDLYVNG